MVLVEAFYTLAALMLALYGFNSLFLAIVYLWRRPHDPTPPPSPEEWPRVTVQLPLYNEINVVERLIRATAALDYPRERLEIQVLDDSDDETTLLVQALVDTLRRQGLCIEHIRRPQRRGYKAGALAYGIERARGEYIAIFDADFVPPADWLKRTVPYLHANPRLGFVQTRWEHLNAFASPVTLAQSLALDGHFAVEQPARAALGWPISFNGSAGLWRRQAILDSGNWQADTLCEDLDLSYRAQMRGWKGQILVDTSVPGEIPPLISAFRQQQARWATGSIQTFRKHVRQLLRTSSLSPLARIQAIIHQTNYLVHPLMLLVFLLTLPMLWSHRHIGVPLAYLSLASLGPPLIYMLAQWRLRRQPRRMLGFPVIMLLGLGIAWSSSRAVWRGLRHNDAAFLRTPKFRLEGQSNRWQGKRYSNTLRGLPWGESLLTLYAVGTALWAWWNGNVYVLPFLFLYALSFGSVALGMFWQTVQVMPGLTRPTSHPPAGIKTGMPFRPSAPIRTHRTAETPQP